MNEIEELSVFGTVRTCKVVKDIVVTIVLDDGFSDNAMKSVQFMMKCQELYPDFPVIETCVTEENLAILVLTK